MCAARDTVDKVLQAATELIAERGYAATTTRAIADRAGVNEVTLFRRFDNKLGILKALGEQWAQDQAVAVVETVADPADVKATLTELARRDILSASRNGGAALRLAFEAQSVPEIGALLAQGPRNNMEGLAAYMRSRQKAGDLRTDLDAEVLAEAFFSLTSSYVMYRYVMGAGAKPEDPMTDTAIEQLIDLYWSGAARGGEENRD